MEDWFAGEEDESWAQEALGTSDIDFEAVEWEPVDEPSRQREAVEWDQRGVRDADLEPGEELRLSPVFSIMAGPHLDISVADRMKILGSKQGQEASDSPTYLTVSWSPIIEACAAATFPFDARRPDSETSNPGTGFPVSENVYCSAKHMMKDETGIDLERFRAALVTTFRPELFSKPSTPRVFLSCNRDLPDVEEVQNWDPIRDAAHFVGVAERYLDAGFWDITDRDLFHDAVEPRRKHKFESFWLPASLDHEAGTTLSAPCAMLSFPCSSTVKNLLRHDAAKLIRQYTFLLLDKYREEIRERASADKVDENAVQHDGCYATFRGELRTKLGLQILRSLADTFSTFNDGDMMLSVGRILKSNDTMVAHSLSSLPGSSGAPIFLLKPGLDLMFVAIHNGSPLKADNYNLATSTNNPSFALQYFMHVIPTLPEPDDLYWSRRQPQRRLEAFSRWLVHNLPTFKRVTALNDAQKAWMSHAESIKEASKKLG